LNLLLAVALWATVIFPSGNYIQAELALSPAQWQQGLSGRKKLEENKGMLFVFPESSYQTFWMKDMRFSIDIIWIDENFQIVGIEKNVPPCRTSEDKCPLYSSPLPVKYVLETKAGKAEKEKLKKGDTLLISFPSLTSEERASRLP